MTKEEAKEYDDISTSEIHQDIIVTQIEINNYEDENIILRRNPIQNRLRIYLNEGKVSLRQTFIIKLSSILKYR